jgi:hypothetical protein
MDSICQLQFAVLAEDRMILIIVLFKKKLEFFFLITFFLQFYCSL